MIRRAFGVIEVLVAVSCMSVALVAIVATIRAARSQSVVVADRIRTVHIALAGSTYVRQALTVPGAGSLTGTAAYVPGAGRLCATGWPGCGPVLAQSAPGTGTGPRTFSGQLGSLQAVRVLELRAAAGNGFAGYLVERGDQGSQGLVATYQRSLVVQDAGALTFTNSQGQLDPVSVTAMGQQLRRAVVRVGREREDGTVDSRSTTDIVLVANVP